MIVEGADVQIFEDLEDAQNALEPWQVSDPDFRVYDSMGRLLAADTDGKRTALSLAETEPSTAAALEEKLRGYLRYRGDAAAASEAGLPTLVRAVAKYAERSFSIRRVLRDGLSRLGSRRVGDADA